MGNVLGDKKALKAVEAEAYRQIMSGMAPTTLAEFTMRLKDWLRVAYPDAPLLTPAAIERQIADTWHRRHELVRGGD
jgi:hypothetical protein